MSGLWQDLGYAARSLARTPGFTTAAVLTLALGIAASTAIFSVVHAVLLSPLAYDDPGRLVRVFETEPPERVGASDRRPVSPANLLAWRQDRDLFEAIAATTSGSNQSVTLTRTGASPLKVAVDRASASLFPLLGVRPILGRGFLPDEEEPGRDDVVVLSGDLWQTHFDSDPEIVGQTLTLDGTPHTVVGVLPRGFRSPDRLNSASNVVLFKPLTFNAAAVEDYGSHFLYVIARLRPHTTLQQTQARLRTIATQAEERYPDMKGWGAHLVRLLDDAVMNVRPTLLALLVAVGCLMLIACANVANLLLAKVTTQAGELAIRAALGAGRLQLARHVLVHSLLLAGAGGALGLVLAVWLKPVLLAFAPTNIPRLSEAGLNAPVFGFTIAMSVITSVLFGVLPAVQAWRHDVVSSLKQVGRTSTSAFGRTSARYALVVAEVAIAVALVVQAGLLISTFRRLQAIDLGLVTESVVAMEIAPPPTKYTQPITRVAFFQQVLEHVQALPGLRSAAVVSHVPFGGSSGGGFLIEGRTPSNPRESDAEFRSASEAYFRTMGIPILAGRSFTSRDTIDAIPVAAINRAMAQRFWANESPLGQRIRRRSGPLELPWLTIVGVVGDVRHLGPSRDPFLEVYVPYTQPTWASSGAPFPFPRELIVRTQGDPMSIVSAVRQQVWMVDEDQPVSAVRTLGSLARGATSRQRFAMLLFAGFGAVGLILAAIGIYSVLAYTVVQRNREIGIRLAMGGNPIQLILMVMREGMSLVALGIVVGLVGAYALTHFSSSLLFGVTPTDPTTFFNVAAVCLGVACIACYSAAAKAARVDPLVALRYE